MFSENIVLNQYVKFGKRKSSLKKYERKLELL